MSTSPKHANLQPIGCKLSQFFASGSHFDLWVTRIDEVEVHCRAASEQIGNRLKKYAPERLTAVSGAYFLTPSQSFLKNASPLSTYGDPKKIGGLGFGDCMPLFTCIPKMRHNIINWLLIKFIVSAIHNYWRINKIRNPCWTSLFIQTHVPINPSGNRMS